MQDYVHTGNKLDTVFILHSLYYMLDDIDILLENVRSWLAPGGEIIIGYGIGRVLAGMSELMFYPEKLMCYTLFNISTYLNISKYLK